MQEQDLFDDFDLLDQEVIHPRYQPPLVAPMPPMRTLDVPSFDDGVIFADAADLTDHLI